MIDADAAKARDSGRGGRRSGILPTLLETADIVRWGDTSERNAAAGNVMIDGSREAVVTDIKLASTGTKPVAADSEARNVRSYS